MISMIIKRIFQMIALLIGISLIVFFSMHLAPGDPAQIIAGPEASKESIEIIRTELGLDDPLVVQYWNYITDVLKGDLGYSYQTSQDVGNALLIRFPNTLKLAVASIIIASLIGVIAGVISALKQNTIYDMGSTFIALVGVSIPNFWLGVVLIIIFAVNLNWLPVGQMNYPWYTMEGIKELILPSITLGTAAAATIARMTRSAMLEVVNADYIRTARAKGTKEKRVIMLHAFRNAMIPVITMIGLNFGTLLGGALVTEKVFAINGVGRLIIDAIAQRDFVMVQGGVLLIAALFVIVNLIVDIIYLIIDPRISYE